MYERFLALAYKMSEEVMKRSSLKVLANGTVSAAHYWDFLQILGKL